MFNTAWQAVQTPFFECSQPTILPGGMLAACFAAQEAQRVRPLWTCGAGAGAAGAGAAATGRPSKPTGAVAGAEAG